MRKKAALPLSEDSIQYDCNLDKSRNTADSQKLIRDVLSTAFDDGPVIQASSGVSFKRLAAMNTDIQTRIIVRMAVQAANGDVRSAEFLFKYGGLEPPKEQAITIKTPTFIDDIEFNVVEDTDVVGNAEEVPMLPAETEDTSNEPGAPVLIEPAENI